MDFWLLFTVCASGFLFFGMLLSNAQATIKKPGPADALALLKAGNQRFCAADCQHPHAGPERLALACTMDQGDFAFATILACSDSRVPVEHIFDAGVMDIFTVRVAGNVATPGVLGSIEYGALHVKTPVVVILGHSQCGAVTACVDRACGIQHQLERNIPFLLGHTVNTAKKVLAANPKLSKADLVEASVEANVIYSIKELFLYSPAMRQAVESGQVMVVGAIYDVGTGQVRWLSPAQVEDQLAEAKADPQAAQNIYAE